MPKKKLLLVGDAVAETAGFLAAAGYEVARADSVREARVMIGDSAPDLILVDGLGMPAALEGLRIPVLLLAEVTGPEPACARSVIYKPCRPRTLIERLEHVLRYDRWAV